MAPKLGGVVVEMGFLTRHPGEGGGDVDGLAEARVVGQVEEDEGGREGIGRHAADGDARPGAVGLLEVGQIGNGGLDGGAGSGVEEQGAEAEGGEQRLAPAAIGFLGGENGAEVLTGDGSGGLVKFGEADNGQGGGGDSGASVEACDGGGFGPCGDELVEQALILSSIPAFFDLSYGHHVGTNQVSVRNNYALTDAVCQGYFMGRLAAEH